jgi:hypothetical protein
MTKEERQQQQEQRQADRLGRIANAQTRQRESDIRTYGEGSALLSGQKSSCGGDARGGIWDVSVDNYKQPDRNETGQNNSVNDGQGIDSIGAGGEPSGGGGGGGGSGLPEYPGTIPNVPDFKGILAWSVAENEALWLQGDPEAEDSESNPLPQVMFYDPTDGIQNFSLIGMQLLDVVICKDGEPVEGQIFFHEDT